MPAFQTDFDEMQRYFYTTFVYQSLTAGVPIQASAYVANAVLLSHVFPRRMCKTPNVVPYGWASHTAGNITNLNGNADFAIATLAANQKGISQGAAPTAAAGAVFATVIRADARLS